MRVVSNASSIINLARIGKVDLLRKLFGEIVLPLGLWHQVVEEGAGQPGPEEVKAATWITTQSTKNKELVPSLLHELDAGEAEATVVALECDADLLLMDERLGRDIASHFGLKYIGLIGALIVAKRNGLMSLLQNWCGNARSWSSLVQNSQFCGQELDFPDEPVKP